MACRIFGAKLLHKSQSNFNRNLNILIQENAFENVVCEMAAILSRPNMFKISNTTATCQLRGIYFLQHSY